MKRNVVAAITHIKSKDVLLNSKCLSRSLNRIQSKDHKIGLFEVNKILLLCFVDKIYFQNNGYDTLALGY